MSHLVNLTFLDICLALLTMGLVDRLLAYLPEKFVGPNGWLLVTRK